jgi:hypothetical protein
MKWRNAVPPNIKLTFFLLIYGVSTGIEPPSRFLYDCYLNTTLGIISHDTNIFPFGTPQLNIIKVGNSNLTKDLRPTLTRKSYLLNLNDFSLSIMFRNLIIKKQ